MADRVEGTGGKDGASRRPSEIRALVLCGVRHGTLASGACWPRVSQQEVLNVLHANTVRLPLQPAQVHEAAWADVDPNPNVERHARRPFPPIP